jgi:ADP-ribose pyrophosphatase YjhB (NUDIX family)
MPDIISEFEYDGHLDVQWYDVLSKDQIPDLPWHQVYIVGDYEGKVPIVVYPDSSHNLPGGKTELGETLEQTMAREVKEEANMRILNWQPLGYQVCIRRETSQVSYQFRAYAKLEKIGDFINDPGGNIQGNKLIDLMNINEYINYGVVGDRLISNAKPYFSQP